MTTTDLTRLAALCAQAVATMHQEQAELEEQADAATVERAKAYAAEVFGVDAAQCLGTWLPVDQAVTPDDTAQATVQIAVGARLIFSQHVDNGLSLALLTWCMACGHHREPRIGSLAELASALHRAGLRSTS